MKKIGIIFFGTPEFAVPALKALIKAPFCDVRLVVTQPDKPVGRHHSTSIPSPVKKIAQEAGIDVITNNQFPITNFQLGVLVAYGEIIPQKLIDAFPLGILNIHPSLLPKYRGPSPIQMAIANGDAETGVSIMLRDAEMDHVPVLTQKIVKMTGTETAPELEARLADAATSMLPDAVARYVAGDFVPTDQDHSRATFTKIITRDDGRIDWSKPAVLIERLFRAYQPWPGIWTEWKRAGRAMRLKLLSVTLEPSASTNPGTVLSDFIVACGSGGLKILRIQPEGKKEMSAEEFLRGHRDVIGSIVS